MSYKIDIHPSDTLRIVCAGILTTEELDSLRENAMTIIRTNDLKNICCDLRVSTFDGKNLDILRFGSSAMQSYQGIRKMAIIYKADKHDPNDLSGYATLANNRGLKVKLFNSRSEALKWLKF